MCSHSNQNCHHRKDECCHVHEVETSPLLRVLAAFVITVAALILHLSGWTKFAVFLSAYLLAGGDILLNAVKNIIIGKVFDENFLMSIATLGAFAIQEYPEAVMVMVLYQIGEYFQHKAVEKSKASITELMDIRPDSANIESRGVVNKVSPDEVKINDIILVRTGEKIPLDGIVTDGSASVDTSALTGESIPKELKVGDNAISGCINLDGVLRIRVTKSFGESTVSKILELVEKAGSKKAKAENFITKFARFYTPIVVIGALFLAILPPLFTGASFFVWLERALTFLVISCPCALVISVPLSFFGGIGGASKCGILIKGSSFIESLANPDSVIFDKTGTLTEGSFKVTNISPVDCSEEELLGIAAMAENFSNHPAAISLKNAYNDEVDASRIKNVEEFAGSGVKASVDNEKILAGSKRLMEKFNVEYVPAQEDGTIVYISVNRKYAGYIVISDEIKTDSQNAVKILKNYVRQIVMLTGDTHSSAESTAKRLGIDKFFAQLMPAQKVEITEHIIEDKQKGKSVVFVGDGINDAPVLTRADVGIAMGSMGSDAAIEASDVVIMDDNPSKVAAAIAISRKTMSIVKQNIVFAIGIKILFLILGAMGFVTMWGAVFADVGVSMIAILNSLRTLQVKRFC